jgi:hypothetical protein
MEVPRWSITFHSLSDRGASKSIASQRLAGLNLAGAIPHHHYRSTTERRWSNVSLSHAGCGD